MSIVEQQDIVFKSFGLDFKGLWGRKLYAIGQAKGCFVNSTTLPGGCSSSCRKLIAKG